MKNPAMLVPDAMQAILALNSSTRQGSVPPETLELVHLRANQINGCSSCVDSGSRSAKKVGETDECLFAVAAWREAPYFTEGDEGAPPARVVFRPEFREAAGICGKATR